MTSTGNGTIDVHDNVVRRVGYGIAIVGADQIAVRRNQVSNTYYGIAAEVVTDSAIRRNTIGAKGFGLYLQGSAGNDVIANTVSGVGGTCIDDSSGSGTAGTDNHWADNTATVGSSPTGHLRGTHADASGRPTRAPVVDPPGPSHTTEIACSDVWRRAPRYRGTDTQDRLIEESHGRPEVVGVVRRRARGRTGHLCRTRECGDHHHPLGRR